MRLVGKIEVDQKHLENPVKNQVRKQKIGLDLKIYDDNGELDNDEVINGGFAYKSRFGFRNKKTGDIVILFEGKGAQTGPGGNYLRVPEGAEHEDCAIPNAGYIADGTGISAILDSNGLRMFPNFKKLPETCYEAFATVEGVGTATFPHGDTICTA